MKHQVLTITTVSERGEVSTQVYLFERLDQAQVNLALCYQSATSARIRGKDEVEKSFILPDQTRYEIRTAGHIEVGQIHQNEKTY